MQLLGIIGEEMTEEKQRVKVLVCLINGDFSETEVFENEMMMEEFMKSRLNCIYGTGLMVDKGVIKDGKLNQAKMWDFLFSDKSNRKYQFILDGRPLIKTKEQAEELGGNY